MTVELDALDLQIVSLLLQDGRMPAAQVAEQIGLSRPAVADRVDKLERQGVIRGTTAVIDPVALGRTVTAFITARGPNFSPAAERRFREIMRRDDVREAHTVAGEDCYLLKVRSESIAGLNALIQELASSPLELTTRTTIVMETHCEKVGGIDLGRSEVDA